MSFNDEMVLVESYIPTLLHAQPYHVVATFVFLARAGRLRLAGLVRRRAPGRQCRPPWKPSTRTKATLEPPNADDVNLPWVEATLDALDTNGGDLPRVAVTLDYLDVDGGDLGGPQCFRQCDLGSMAPKAATLHRHACALLPPSRCISPARIPRSLF
jgi:hypothetical protein